MRWVQCELEGPILRTDRAAVWVVPGQHRARHRPSAAKDCLRSDKRGRRRHGGGEGNAQPREDTRAGRPVQEVLRGHHVFVRVRPEDHHRAGARCQQDEEHAPSAARRSHLRAALRAGQGHAPVRPVRGRDDAGVLGALPERPERPDRRHVRVVLGQHGDPYLCRRTPRG